MKKRTCKTMAVMASVALTVVLSGCGAKDNTATAATAETTALESTQAVDESTSDVASAETEAIDTSASMIVAAVTSDGALDATDFFTDRDLAQVADTSNAQSLVLTDGQDVTITEEGVYVVTGTATNATIIVEADDAAKVQIVLDGATITNDSAPAIYVKSADKVFVTTAAGSENTLSVTGTFEPDGDTNTDAVIFSKDDLTLNGTGTLFINSTNNAVTSKDDLKVTGGTYEISAGHHGLEANDSVRIADGTLSITAGTDGIHAENSDDDTLGYVYICGGSLAIQAGSDGIQATTVAQVDGGEISISAAEGIEGTYVQLNGGNVYVSASDDGINATTKSYSWGTPTIEIRGGEVTVDMAAGDTDALDANGNLYISGGTVTLNGQSAFDYDGYGELSGGTVYVNGEQITTMQNSMMGGGMGGMGGRGGMGGGPQGESFEPGGEPSMPGGGW